MKVDVYQTNTDGTYLFLPRGAPFSSVPEPVRDSAGLQHYIDTMELATDAAGSNPSEIQTDLEKQGYSIHQAQFKIKEQKEGWVRWVHTRDVWSATLSVADALTEAEKLISEFKDGNATLENQPPEPITRSIPYVPETAIFVPPPISMFNNFAQLKSLTGKFSGKFIHETGLKNGTRGRGIILTANFGEERLDCPGPFSSYFGTSGKPINGDWFYLKDPLRRVMETNFGFQPIRVSPIAAEGGIHPRTLMVLPHTSINKRRNLRRAIANTGLAFPQLFCSI
jgi:uncharacterized protein YcgL (UPF0745 family)